MSEFNLSEKSLSALSVWCDKNPKNTSYFSNNDVKEFIKLLRKEFMSCEIRQLIDNKIDKLAGDKLN